MLSVANRGPTLSEQASLIFTNKTGFMLGLFILFGELHSNAYVYLSLVFKGKKNVLTTEDSVERKASSRKETKENKPATNKVCFCSVLF